MCVKRKKWVCHVRACEGERLRERVRACLRRPWCVSDSTWLVQENEGGKNILSKLNRLSVPSLPPLSLPLPPFSERKKEREKSVVDKRSTLALFFYNIYRMDGFSSNDVENPLIAGVDIKCLNWDSCWWTGRGMSSNPKVWATNLALLQSKRTTFLDLNIFQNRC